MYLHKPRRFWKEEQGFLKEEQQKRWANVSWLLAIQVQTREGKVERINRQHYFFLYQLFKNTNLPRICMYECTYLFVM